MLRRDIGVIPSPIWWSVKEQASCVSAKGNAKTASEQVEFRPNHYCLG